MAVEHYALHGDEEADAVREYARREEEAAAEQELALEDPGLLADLEEEAQPEGPPEAIPVAQPDSPSEHEREIHRLTHLPFAPWCEYCTSGKARQDHHRRDQSSEKEGTGMVQMDYFFLATEKEEEVSVRESPPKQHQSQGAVESMNGFVASQVRALWMDVRARYPELDVSCNLTPWLVRHAAWLIARYHTRSRDGLTPYRMVNGADYNHPLATLGEIVLGKIPMPKGKLQRRWLKGVWLGKLDRDDSHVIGTSAGAIAVRSIRRLPRESQTDKELMSEMKGIPWQPRDGVRHKVTREVSQPAIVPAPAAAGDSAPAEDPKDEAHPTLAEDGEKVDEEGVTVMAAAQLEELIGPMDDEGEHFSAGVAAEDDMVDSPTPPPSPPTAAAASSGQLPPFRGAGWSSNLQSLPDEPTSPSGLGEGGKREREHSAQLTPGESEPKQSRQAGVLQHLTNREIWEKIQEWGNAEEANNPTAIQRISNVTDFVDQLLDPQEVEKARKEQLAKLWARGEKAHEYVTNLLALIGLWVCWVKFVGPAAGERLPLFCAFIHALQLQLAEDIGAAMLNPGDDDVKPEPTEEEKQGWAHFCLAVETEIRTGAPLVVDGIMSEATRAGNATPSGWQSPGQFDVLSPAGLKVQIRTSFLWRPRSKAKVKLPPFAAVMDKGAQKFHVQRFDVKLAKAPPIRNEVAQIPDASM
eukprot:s2889_g10.t1